MSKIVISREHHFSYAHRLHCHPGACKRIHGHEGRLTFHVSAQKLSEQGMVTDFGVIKEKLCGWIDKHWDHRFFIYENDTIAKELKKLDPDAVMLMPFNPTSENMALYLLEEVGPKVLASLNCTLVKVDFHETANCYASVSLD